MIIILSPAKSLNFKTDSPFQSFSLPAFVNEAQILINVLKCYSPDHLTELMNISNGLGELNYLRFQKWETAHNNENSKQAIFAFNGEVYNGFRAHTLTADEIDFTQKHIRILSGLYGVLNPLDLIQPYRLEMGTKLKVDAFRNLYSFWGEKISSILNEELEKHKSACLINLASHEYSKAAKLKEIKSQVITPVFKEFKDGSYRVIAVYAKKARGLMSRFIVSNKIDIPEDIKHFDAEGYHFCENLSSGDEWVFTR